MTGTANQAATAAIIDIEVLGHFRAHRGSQDIPLTPTQRLLLLVLLCAAGHPVGKNTLQRRVLDRQPGPRAEQTLRRHISDLRTALGRGTQAISLSRAGGQTAYRLDPGTVRTDAALFEQHAAVGSAALQAGRWTEAASQLQAAAALWHEPPHPELTGRPFALSWTTRLDGWHRAAITGHAEARIRLGQHLQVIPALQVQTAQYPGDGALWQLLVIALYAARRDGDAAQALRDAIAAYHHQGLDPGQFTQLQRNLLTLTLPRDGNLALDAVGFTPRSASMPPAPDSR
jgi:DNA-binding SARP family transcriptional activator